MLPNESVEFRDARHGACGQRRAEQCGDLLLCDPAGNWTCQFCVTVDDLRQQVDLVLRGDDLIASTGRQLLLAGMLGRQAPPAFLHHPLIFSPTPGGKLSKRDRLTGLAALREAGCSPEQVLGDAAHRTGLLERPRAVRPADLGGLVARLAGV